MLQFTPTRVGKAFMTEASKVGYAWKYSHWSVGRGGHLPQDPTKAIEYSGTIDIVELPELLLGPVELTEDELLNMFDVTRDTPLLRVSLKNFDINLISIGEVSNFGLYVTKLWDPSDPDYGQGGLTTILAGVGNFPLGLKDEIEIDII